MWDACDSASTCSRTSSAGRGRRRLPGSLAGRPPGGDQGARSGTRRRRDVPRPFGTRGARGAARFGSGISSGSSSHGEAEGRPYPRARIRVGRLSRATSLAEGWLQLEEMLRVMAEVGPGLDALHRAGIVHRDVKPRTSCFARTARRADRFRAREGRRLYGADARGSVVGTLDYLAPELVRGEEATPASDVTRSAASSSNASPVAAVRRPQPPRRRHRAPRGRPARSARVARGRLGAAPGAREGAGVQAAHRDHVCASAPEPGLAIVTPSDAIPQPFRGTSRGTASTLRRARTPRRTRAVPPRRPGATRRRRASRRSRRPACRPSRRRAAR